MICPECKSKLLVKDSREKGFKQIRFRMCENKDCEVSMVTEEKLHHLRKPFLNPPYLNGFEINNQEP